jgi:L-malate glycosyltransferase
LPYIISLRGADVPGYAERFSFLYKFIKPIIKKIWESSFAVVSNSKGLRELALRSKPDQNIHIIYNGVDVDNFRPLNSEINEKIYSKKKDFIVTPGASRITSRKGLIYLIEAVGKVFLKHPEILLEIMGDGSKEEKKELKDVAEKNKIKNRVVFLGRIPREKTFSYYQRADVFALPSLNEGMSNAMLEALATGLPIVSTDTGGAKELVGEGVNGYIVKMRNSQDIADRLERLIIDSNLRKKMGEESRKKAENFSWKKVAEKYFELYEKTKK